MFTAECRWRIWVLTLTSLQLCRMLANYHTEVLENIKSTSSQPCPPQKGHVVRSACGTPQTHPCAPTPPGSSPPVFPRRDFPCWSPCLLPVSGRAAEAGTTSGSLLQSQSLEQDAGQHGPLYGGWGVDGWRDGRGNTWMNEGRNEETNLSRCWV